MRCSCKMQKKGFISKVMACAAPFGELRPDGDMDCSHSVFAKTKWFQSQRF